MIYITDISEVSLKDTDLLSKYRCERAERKKNHNDKLLSIAASLLLRYALLQTGLTEANMVYAKNEHGKPYFKNCADISFSLSDSDIYAACVVSNTAVGVDVQKIVSDRNYLKLAKRYFTEKEYKYVSETGESEFFRLWTRKESLLKALGTGISAGLKKHEILEDCITIGDVDFGFFDSEIDKGVKLSCCSLGGRENKIMYLKRTDLI